MSSSAVSVASPALVAPRTEAQAPRYSLVPVLAMPISFALVLLLTRLAAG